MKGLIIAIVANTTANGQTMGRRHVSRVGELAGQSEIFYFLSSCPLPRWRIRIKRKITEETKQLPSRERSTLCGIVIVHDRLHPICSLSKNYEEVFA